jgi:hypothetical protein
MAENTAPTEQQLKRLGGIASAVKSYGGAAITRAQQTTLYAKSESLYAGAKEHRFVKARPCCASYPWAHAQPARSRTPARSRRWSHTCCT